MRTVRLIRAFRACSTAAKLKPSLSSARAMAAAGPVQGLQEEATCPICLEYFTDPVTTKCGHNFCRSCISACPEGAAGAALPCPQCRELCPQGDLRANRQLQSMVQLVRQLSVQQERPPGEGLCEKHEEKLKLFCEEDQKLICLVCRESRDHKQHQVCPTDEAAQKYKSELQDSLQTLREQLGAVQQRKLKEEESCSLLRSKLETERRKIATEFEGLRQRLKETEETLLRRLEEMEKKITREEQSTKAKLSAEMTSLEYVVREIEKTCEQPAGEFLKDVRRSLSRCEDLRISLTPARIKKYKVLVTLDADSAHRCLALSEDGRRVTNAATDQRPPGNPQRFTGPQCVLGREVFTTGRHYWELKLLWEGGWGWAVGAARESVSRKDRITHTPEGGVWAVEGFKDEYQALTSPPTRLSLRQSPLVLGFYLDCAGGRLSVYNAETLEVLYTFTDAPFTGGVRPYLSLSWGADLHLV